MVGGFIQFVFPASGHVCLRLLSLWFLTVWTTTWKRFLFSDSSFSAILNFCANNYLGLSSHPEVVQAGLEALRSHGAGLSSVRFICGTQVNTRHLSTNATRPT